MPRSVLDGSDITETASWEQGFAKFTVRSGSYVFESELPSDNGGQSGLT